MATPDKFALVNDQLMRILQAKNDLKDVIIGCGGELNDLTKIDKYADQISGLVDLFNKCCYKYSTATVDEAGLRSLGWDNTDIGYFKYNELFIRPDTPSVYNVTDANKAIDINKEIQDNPDLSIQTILAGHRSDSNFIFCPKFNVSGTGADYWFKDMAVLKIIPLLDTSNIYSMNSMFQNCGSLITIPPINTSKVSIMDNMFRGCSSLEKIPMIDTSNTETMRNMFSGCTNIKTIPAIVTSKVDDMDMIFANCTKLTSLPEMDLSKVTTMNNAFTMLEGCRSLTTIGGFVGLKTNIDLSMSPLTKESLLNLFNKAADVTSNPMTMTIGSRNKAKLTQAEMNIAINKGWTIR